MTHKYVVTSASVLPVMADNSNLMDVAYDVVSVDENDTGTVVQSLRQGFPLGTTEQEIRDALQRAVDLYVEEKERSEAQAEQNILMQETVEVLDSLLG